MLFVLIGIPGAGKTTLAKTIRDEFGARAFIPLHCHTAIADAAHDDAATATAPAPAPSLVATASIDHGLCVTVHHVNFDQFLHQSLSATATASSLSSPATSSTVSSNDSNSEFNVAAWHESRRVALDHTRSLLHRCQHSSTSAPNDWHIIIVDDNQQYRSMRHTLYQMAQEGNSTPFMNFLLTFIIFAHFSLLIAFER
jgi:tRNA uridine 5-carbamoylmethylation protein Kti12